MLEDIDNYYLQQKEPTRGCMLALRELILSLDINITHEWKYRMPFFCYQRKMFCYLWTDKKTHAPYIGIVEGKHLHHSLLEQGNRSRMKILSIDPAGDIPINTIKTILNEALDLYKQGIVKLK